MRVMRYHRWGKGVYEQGVWSEYGLDSTVAASPIPIAERRYMR